MAQLWLELPDVGWTPHVLTASVVNLAPHGEQPVVVPRDFDTGVSLHRVRLVSGGDSWLMLAAGSHDVRVNGASPLAGIRALADRDQIALGATTIYFSTESLAIVEPFVATGTSAYCPRCKKEIKPATPTVRCPQCAVVHHATEDLPCWSYAERCALCDQLTDLSAGYRWTPEGL